MNLILIMADSLRVDHIGCYGNDWIETPNIDALAKESVLFEGVYPEALPTIPVRRALMTGNRTFPFKDWHPWKGEGVKLPGWQPLYEEDVTIAERLTEEGYISALITDTYHMFKPRMNFHRGFSSWQWIRGQEADPYKTKPLENIDLDHYLKPEMDKGTIRGLIQYLKNVADRESEDDYFAPSVFGAGMKWLEDNYKQDKIFLWLDSFDPHEPWDPPAYYVDKYYPGYKGKEIIFPMGGDIGYLSEDELRYIRALYAGEVTMLDRWLGKFIEKVKDLDLWDNTLLVFISDHGHPLGENKIIKKVPSALHSPLLRIALLVKHPDGDYAGKRIKPLVYNHHITPTMLNILGIEGAEEMDGQDLWPLVTGEQKDGLDHIICGNNKFICVRDTEWSYIKMPQAEDSKLFNLVEDPTEQDNVIGDHPNIVKIMEERLRELREAKG